jgi:hypothetical protein
LRRLSRRDIMQFYTMFGRPTSIARLVSSVPGPKTDGVKRATKRQKWP